MTRCWKKLAGHFPKGDHANLQLETQLVRQIMHQNIAIMLQQFNYVQK